MSDAPPGIDWSHFKSKNKGGAPTKFTAEKKRVYLTKLEQWGKKNLSAQAAGVCMETVSRHREEDDDFAKAEVQALDQRAERIVAQLEAEAIDGHTQPIFDKDGCEIGEKRIYETPLRVKVLARFDPNYRDRHDLNVKGDVSGVLVAPPAMTMDDWTQAAEKLREDMLDAQRARAEEDAAEAAG